MLLKQALIKHYKSLDEVRVLFERITILVGPNGVGKSNFVDALKFFRDLATDGLDHAVITREGIDRLRQTYKSRPYNVSIDLDFESDSPWLAQYALNLSGKEGEYRVESESSSYTVTDYFLDQDDVPESKETFKTFDRKKDGSVLIDGKEYERKVRADLVAIGQPVDFEVLGSSIVDFARGWHFCSLYPNTLRKLSPPTKENRLLEDGSNWAGIVRGLRKTKTGRSALDRIGDVMRVALDGYSDITVETAGSYLVPRIARKAGHQVEQKFDPVQLSDGTLRVFGILLALYQEPPPLLLVVEEPEQTIHPGVLPALAEAFKEASLRTQIIVTTHSPELVDQFEPSQIRVVWAPDGLTRISNVKRSQVDSVKQHLMSLREYMAAEGLEPNEVA
jgi:predicted ATPase